MVTRHATVVRCGRKNRYPDELTAIGAALRYSLRRGIGLRVYPCATCSGFHLTSWTTKEKP